MGPAFTQEQRIERAHMQVKRTGLYQTAVVEWEGFELEFQTWPQWKTHFIEAYELREAAGITASAGGYHGAANAAEDDDANSICASINNMHAAHNAAVQAVSEETRELRTALVATQQQLAMLMQAGPREANLPAWNPIRTQAEYNSNPYAFQPFQPPAPIQTIQYPT